MRILMTLWLVACATPKPPARLPLGEADLSFLKDLAETRYFRLGKPSQVRLLPDGSAVLFLRAEARKPEQRLYKMDLNSGGVKEIITPEQVLKGAAETLSPEEKARRERMRVTLKGFTSYQLSEDGARVLVTLDGRAFVIALADASVREVAGRDKSGAAVFDPKLSPDGKMLAFVRAGELWVVPVAGGPEKQLTTGATATRVHAQAEFIAAEELDRATGYWWSPDSQQLAYEEYDTSGLERRFAADPADPMSSVPPEPYPRPGKKNAKVSLFIVPAAGGKATPVKWDDARYEYLAQVVWSRGGPLTLTLLTRDQRDMSLAKVDATTGASTELLHEHDDVFLNVQAPYWLRDGAGFLWESDRAGPLTLELHTPDGKLTNVVAGKDYQDVLGVDLKKRSVFIRCGATPVDSQVWEAPLAGGAAAPMTKGSAQHMAVFARDSRAHVVFASSEQAFATTEVFRADGTSAGPLPSVAEQPPFLPKAEIAMRGGFMTAMVRPRPFDPKQKYPVLVRVYGGPHATVVHRVAESYVENQWIADHGFIVVSIDNRGTPGRGRDWERAIYGKLADVPLEDQVAGLKALSEAEPAMDLSRVGITGGSYGGYMSALAVLKRPDVFHAAVAVSSVTDWRSYDTAYTERYLGVPKDGAAAEYEANSLIPLAKDLRGALLLVHGTADDNVLFAHTLALADALFRAGKYFELLPLVGQTHVPKEPDLQLRYFERVFDFFHRHLANRGESRER